MNCPCIERNNIRMGNVPRNEAAMIVPYSTLYGPTRLETASVNVNMSPFDNTTKGHKKSFHEAVKNSIASTARAGRAIGRMICQ